MGDETMSTIGTQHFRWELLLLLLISSQIFVHCASRMCPRLVTDMARAKREGYYFGAKLVRGAYMFLERERAEKMKYPSPVYDTIEQTHENFNRCSLTFIRL